MAKSGRKNRFTAKQVAQSLTETHGMVYVTAKRLNVTPQTIYNYIRKFQVCATAKEQAEGDVVDVAELNLYQAIQNGEQWAIAFILKTKGKNRGYTERTENANFDFDVTKLTTEQLIRLQAGEDIIDILTAK